MQSFKEFLLEHTIRDVNDRNDHKSPPHRMRINALNAQYDRYHSMDDNKRTPDQHKRYKALEQERAHRGFKPRMHKDHSNTFQSVKPKHNIHWTDEHGNKYSGY